MAAPGPSGGATPPQDPSPFGLASSTPLSHGTPSPGITGTEPSSASRPAWQLQGASSISAMSPFMQSQPSAFLKNTNVESLDILCEGIREESGSQNSSAHRSEGAPSPSALFEASLEAPQTASIGDRGATAPSSDYPLGNSCDRSSGSLPQLRQRSGVQEAERHGDLTQHAPGTAAPLPGTRQDMPSLGLPPAPHQILTPRPSREDILGEEAARAGVVGAGVDDPHPAAVSPIPVPQPALAVPRAGPAAATVSAAPALGVQTTAGLYTGAQLPTLVPQFCAAPQQLWDANVHAIEQQQAAARQAALLSALQQQQQLQLQTTIALQQASAAGFMPATAGLLPTPVLMDPSSASFLSSQGLTGIDSGGFSSLSSGTGTSFTQQQSSVINAATRNPDAASPKNRAVRVLVTATRDVIRAAVEDFESGSITRLVAVPQTRSRADLLTTCLNRILPGGVVALRQKNTMMTAQSGGGSPSRHAHESKSPSSSPSPATSMQQYTMRYHLPQDPSVLVDLLDDGDITSMWEELGSEAALAQEDGIPAPKLQLEIGLRSGFGASMRPSDSAESDEVDLAFSPSAADSYPGSGEICCAPQEPEVVEDPESSKATPVPEPSSGEMDDPVARERRIDAARRASMQLIPPAEVCVLSELGRGPYGSMYRGRWRDCDVGVKILMAARVGMAGAGASAWREFVLQRAQAQSLRHPNLVEVYAFAVPDDKQQVEEQQEIELGCPTPPQQVPGVLTAKTASVIMEYVSGRSLGSALVRHDSLIVGRQHRLLYLTDTARAMEYLHSKRVTHFDLKSSNVLLGWRGRRPVAKVCGFTIARHSPANRELFMTLLAESEAGNLSSLERLGALLPWTAPEVIRAPGKVSHKVDVFAFGLIMWEALAMRSAAVDDAVEYTRCLLNTSLEMRPDQVIEPPVVEPGPGYITLMQDCWAEDPDARPEFSQIVERLRRIAHAVKVEEDAAAAASKEEGL